MNIRLQSSRSGIALVIVMIVILVLGVLAGGFAYSMKVETRLARNTGMESEMEWLGRSGVEMARYVLAQQSTIVSEPYDALNQAWAGGIGVTNEATANVTLKDIEMGAGKFSISIVDMERKVNINIASEQVLEKALTMVGIEAADQREVIDAILDWIDPDDNTRLQGAESEEYQANDPPYFAKNGPVDDLSELLLVRGISEDIYWGLGEAAVVPTTGFQDEGTVYGVGLVDVFTTVSMPRLNLNTAPSYVLQLIPGIDAGLAQGIVSTRSGPDGIDGTEDDLPFQNVNELINVPGMIPEFVQQMGQFFTVRSGVFEVTVEAQIDNYKRTFKALLQRNSSRDVAILYFHWE